MDCMLCGLPLPHHPIVEQGASFCCHGCHAVFQILAAKRELADPRAHPLFKQAVKAGLISNPSLLADLQARQCAETAQGSMKLYLEIGDMWCPSCAELVRLVLLQERGVVQCVVDYCTDLAFIEYIPTIISKDRIKERITALGYSPRTLDAPEQSEVSYPLYVRFAVAAFCSLNVMMFAYPLYATYFDFDGEGVGSLFAWLSLAVSLPVVTYCAWPIYRRAAAAVSVGIVGMEALVSLGVASAFAFSLFDLLRGGTQVYFDSMTVVVVFVLLGKIIEMKAKFSAKSSLLRLYRAVPKRGRKQMDDGSWRFVPIKEIAPGDFVQVLLGEKVVLDGIVAKGSGSCDESLMTGEPMPIVKEAGSRVLAGAILQSGTLEIEVTAGDEESALHRILQMIESDIAHKSPYVRAVDPWVKVFVPAVLLFAAGVFLVCLPMGLDAAATRTLAVLLISCPCAIGIAAPLAESHLMHALTNLGAVVRNRGALNLLGRETAYLFDKTGTITYGLFAVTGGLELLTEEDKRVVRAMTLRSVHPVATAIAKAVGEAAAELDFVEEHAGRGIAAAAGPHRYLLGSRQFLTLEGCSVAPPCGAATTVYFGKDGKVIAALQLGDRVRTDAPALVDALKPVQSWLVSGDTRGAVECAARVCAISQWEGEASPLRKRELVDALKRGGEVVCFVGDGINDAPALTAADVGISVLTAADISVQVSDILLTTDRLEVIPRMRDLAVKARRIIVQNLFWAFFYNVVGIFLAAAGVLSPIFAAAAMVASSLIVLFNAQRLSGAGASSLIDPSARKS